MFGLLQQPAGHLDECQENASTAYLLEYQPEDSVVSLIGSSFLMKLAKVFNPEETLH